MFIFQWNWHWNRFNTKKHFHSKGHTAIGIQNEPLKLSNEAELIGNQFMIWSKFQWAGDGDLVWSLLIR